MFVKLHILTENNPDKLDVKSPLFYGTDVSTVKWGNFTHFFQNFQISRVHNFVNSLDIKINIVIRCWFGICEFIRSFKTYEKFESRFQTVSFLQNMCLEMFDKHFRIKFITLTVKHENSRS